MNIWNLFSLKEKVLLVSGGDGNYGRCITGGLAEAGGTVIITSIDMDHCKAVAGDFCKNGLDVHAMELDQSDHNSVIRLKNGILEKFGKLDVFVNNAVARPMKSYEDSMDHFELSMKVNATGTMDVLREMAELISRNETGGSVINIASIMGMFGPDLSNYEGTDMGYPAPDYFFHNAGLINLNRYLTRMFVGKNVRFNCVSPGGLFNHQPQRFLENYCKKVPLGRMANQDDIKGVMVLLASEAGAYINGENILMDGGMHA
jgi:NAD(P)-dependent dehydrogenase (short-subunit alcohol dehydrogenase family)